MASPRWVWLPSVYPREQAGSTGVRHVAAVASRLSQRKSCFKNKYLRQDEALPPQGQLYLSRSLCGKPWIGTKSRGLCKDSHLIFSAQTDGAPCLRSAAAVDLAQMGLAKALGPFQAKANGTVNADMGQP